MTYNQRSSFVFIACMGPLLTTCGGTGPIVHPIVTGSGEAGSSGAQPQGPAVVPGDPKPGLTVRLSEGRLNVAGASGARTRAAATKIPEAEAQSLLARLPAMQTHTGDKKPFALRQGPTAPARAGAHVQVAFPPKASPRTPPGQTKGALRVTRFAPEGNVPIAPHLSVTFSQPMVAVTSQANAASYVPVTLTPQPKGTWRWAGTRTLLFDPDVRFPQATTYRVHIPADAKSATGRKLGQDKTWTFTTPAPRLLSSWPSGQSQPREPVMFALFDQRIDRAEVAKRVVLRVNRAPDIGVVLVDDDTAAKDDHVKELIARAKNNDHQDRYIVFRPAKPLRLASTVTVEFAKGTPSKEGPRVTSSVQSFHFDTFHPLKVVHKSCERRYKCSPRDAWSIAFNNPLKQDAFDPASISISPGLPGVEITSWDRHIRFEVSAAARTKYTVTLPGALTDTFGQRLGRPVTVDMFVGDSQPRLWGPRGLVVLDPNETTPSVGVFSSSFETLQVKAYQVQPTDWDAYTKFAHVAYREKRGAPPGKKMIDKAVKIAGKPGAIAETRVELSSVLSGGLGHAVIDITPQPWKHRYPPPRLIAWVQSTRIGLDAFVDREELVAWATDLATGAPLSGVGLEIAPYAAKGTTDNTGVSRVALKSSKSKRKRVLIARSGADTAILPKNMSEWGTWGSWDRRTQAQMLRWYVIDDRKMYRPGEKVSIKGWLRVFDGREGGGIEPLTGRVAEVSYEVLGSQGNKIGTGRVKVNAAGGFHTTLQLPSTPNLGHARIQFKAIGKSALASSRHTHYFQIQEFRRPEFEVTSSASQGPHFVGGSADVTVHAKYYAGGALGGAPVAWNVHSLPASFTPPNRSDYVFGNHRPWWLWRSGPQATTTNNETLRAKTDGSGRHVLRIDFVSANPPQPMSVQANSSVTDVNRQTWSSGTSLLVHPSSVYVGLKARRAFVEQGKPLDLDVIVVDLDGKAQTNRSVKVVAARLDWVRKKRQWLTEEKDPQTCNVTSAAESRHCQFQTPKGGSYQITATTADAKGRKTQTQMQVWVTGGQMPPSRTVEQEKVLLIPDKKAYEPGDTAQIMVQAPFSPAEALITFRRSGIVSTQRMKLAKTTGTIRVPIAERQIPNLIVQVDLVGAAARVDDDGKPRSDLPKRPAFATGTVNLQIPPKRRTLQVKVSPAATKVAPGAKTSIDVEITDAAGKPAANAEVAALVVDESVLALSNYKLPDPIGVFYRGRGAGATNHYLRPRLRLARPDKTRLTGRANNDQDGLRDKEDARPAAEPRRVRRNGGAVDTKTADATFSLRAGLAKSSVPGGGQAPAIAIRTNFNALAAFSPEMKTDARGRTRLTVTMPDSLTRYRVMVVAVHGANHFGSAESAITARKPLMLRPSAPRFLNFGDKFELPVVLQNQTSSAINVKVALRAHNAAVTDGAGRAVRVPANDRVEVRLPAAAEMPGQARFQLVATSGSYQDASEFSLPVWTPATTEAFATYGVLDRGAIRQPVALPTGVVKDFGGLEVTTSSTQLQALTDAFLYLVSYPFECSEQISSRILAVASLRDVLTAFEVPELPSPTRISRAVQRDLEALSGLQNHDGGFPFWRRGFESWPFLTVHVAHALIRAEGKGYQVKARTKQRALRYLGNIERHIPGYYPAEVRRTIVAYALWVRKLAGQKKRLVNKARQLVKIDGGLKNRSMEAVGWLLGVFANERGTQRERAAIMRHLANKTVETAGAANFSSHYSDGAHLILHSNRRVDGILLESLIAANPKSDLIPKLVRGLLAHKKKGRWGNTQENTFVLLALHEYFRTYEKVTPNFVADVWLGDRYAGRQRFRGRSTDRKHIDIPMAEVARVGKGDLAVAKTGKGRLYYRIGMRYAPQDLALASADYGFAVERTYEAVDSPSDVTRLSNGTWKIKAGARVRVRLTMVAESRRYHVALVDPLPAGFETMNPELAVTGPIPQDPSSSKKSGRFWWWTRPWYEHQNMRDERVEAFASLLWGGVHQYSYVARATTPGTFVVPPTRAEEMYHPETFGRSGSDRVVVE